MSNGEVSVVAVCVAHVVCAVVSGVTIVAVNAINGFVRLCAISRDCALDVTEKGGGVLPREVCRKR